MGFYTYSETNTGKNVFAGFVAWLKEHGVSCEGNDSSGLLSIHDFNGMGGSFTLKSMIGSTSYAHNFTLVTDAGKELILIQGKQTSTSALNSGKILVECLIVNNNGSLFTTNMWAGSNSVAQGYFPSLGSSVSVTTDATADNYLIPLVIYPSDTKYVFNNYFFSINFVEVPPGIVISDGTKQFISCGLFLFVEYDPATMRA